LPDFPEEHEQTLTGVAFRPPEMVFERPAAIRIFQVTDEKLNTIKNAASNVSQDFGFMTLSLGIFFTSLAALLTTNQQVTAPPVFYFFLVLAIGTFFVALYTGTRWYRYRRRLPDLIDEILNSHQTQNSAA
jgi:hypothetical protein